MWVHLRRLCRKRGAQLGTVQRAHRRLTAACRRPAAEPRRDLDAGNADDRHRARRTPRAGARGQGGRHRGIRPSLARRRRARGRCAVRRVGGVERVDLRSERVDLRTHVLDRHVRQELHRAAEALGEHAQLPLEEVGAPARVVAGDEELPLHLREPVWRGVAAQAVGEFELERRLRVRALRPHAGVLELVQPVDGRGERVALQLQRVEGRLLRRDDLRVLEDERERVDRGVDGAALGAPGDVRERAHVAVGRVAVRDELRVVVHGVHRVADGVVGVRVARLLLPLHELHARRLLRQPRRQHAPVLAALRPEDKVLAPQRRREAGTAERDVEVRRRRRALPGGALLVEDALLAEQLDDVVQVLLVGGQARDDLLQQGDRAVVALGAVVAVDRHVAEQRLALRGGLRGERARLGRERAQHPLRVRQLARVQQDGVARLEEVVGALLRGEDAVHDVHERLPAGLAVVLHQPQHLEEAVVLERVALGQRREVGQPRQDLLHRGLERRDGALVEVAQPREHLPLHEVRDRLGAQLPPPHHLLDGHERAQDGLVHGAVQRVVAADELDVRPRRELAQLGAPLPQQQQRAALRLHERALVPHGVPHPHDARQHGARQVGARALHEARVQPVPAEVRRGKVRDHRQAEREVVRPQRDLRRARRAVEQPRAAHEQRRHGGGDLCGGVSPERVEEDPAPRERRRARQLAEQRAEVAEHLLLPLGAELPHDAVEGAERRARGEHGDQRGAHRAERVLEPGAGLCGGGAVVGAHVAHVAQHEREQVRERLHDERAQRGALAARVRKVGDPRDDDGVHGPVRLVQRQQVRDEVGRDGDARLAEDVRDERDLVLQPLPLVPKVLAGAPEHHRHRVRVAVARQHADRLVEVAQQQPARVDRVRVPRRHHGDDLQRHAHHPRLEVRVRGQVARVPVLGEEARARREDDAVQHGERLERVDRREPGVRPLGELLEQRREVLVDVQVPHRAVDVPLEPLAQHVVAPALLRVRELGDQLDEHPEDLVAQGVERARHGVQRRKQPVRDVHRKVRLLVRVDRVHPAEAVPERPGVPQQPRDDRRVRDQRERHRRHQQRVPLAVRVPGRLLQVHRLHRHPAEELHQVVRVLDEPVVRVQRQPPRRHGRGRPGRPHVQEQVRGVHGLLREADAERLPEPRALAAHDQRRRRLRERLGPERDRVRHHVLQVVAHLHHDVVAPPHLPQRPLLERDVHVVPLRVVLQRLPLPHRRAPHRALERRVRQVVLRLVHAHLHLGVRRQLRLRAAQQRGQDPREVRVLEEPHRPRHLPVLVQRRELKHPAREPHAHVLAALQLAQRERLHDEERVAAHLARVQAAEDAQPLTAVEVRELLRDGALDVPLVERVQQAHSALRHPARDDAEQQVRGPGASSAVLGVRVRVQQPGNAVVVHRHHFPRDRVLAKRVIL